jgi:hypothetical protein
MNLKVGDPVIVYKPIWMNKVHKNGYVNEIFEVDGITVYRVYLNETDEDCWYSDPVFDDWKEWVDYIKSTFNVDKGKLRMDKFKAIGI